MIRVSNEAVLYHLVVLYVSFPVSLMNWSISVGTKHIYAMSSHRWNHPMIYHGETIFCVVHSCYSNVSQNTGAVELLAGTGRTSTGGTTNTQVRFPAYSVQQTKTELPMKEKLNELKC